MIYLISGIILCLITSCVFICLRVKKGETYGLISKIVASFCFVALALVLYLNKSDSNQFTSLSITMIIFGLLCGLIGDIILDLKVMYHFHKNQYLYAGITSFLIGHLFYIAGIFLIASPYESLLKYHLIPVFIIFISSIILAIIIYFVSKKLLKLNYENFTILVNIYSFILIFTTILAIYSSFIITTIPTYILAIGFVMFLISDLILSLQYFGDKEKDKTLIIINHAFYYLAQIIISSFIFFI